MNKAAFYTALKGSPLFPSKLTQGVVDTCEAIFNEYERRKVCDIRFMAYTFATAYRESYSAKKNPDWNPVREGFKTTDASSIAYVRDVLKLKYWAIQPNGKSYFGRGWVQITHPSNYKNVGRLIGEPLYDNPDLALQRPVAAKILVGGIIGGWFTGKGLPDYFNDKISDAFNARKTINGLDAAKEIEGNYKIFLACLSK